MGSAQGRLDLTAPVAQLLGHDLYADANNVIPSPLILPKIDWSTAASFSQSSAAQPLDITNPAMPGFGIQLPASHRGRRVAGHRHGVRWPSCPPRSPPSTCRRASAAACCFTRSPGSDLSEPVQLTLPNTAGFKPRARCSTLVTFNPVTGGHDVVGQMVVSADGQTMTSTGSSP